METVCLSTSFAKLQQCLDLDIGPALARLPQLGDFGGEVFDIWA